MSSNHIVIDKSVEVEIWSHDGKVWLSVESGDDRAVAAMTLEQASNVRDALAVARLATIEWREADEIERLRLEVETLRRYGNKDCTAQADAALKQKLSTGKAPWED